MLSLMGLLGGLILLIALVVRGTHLLVAAPLAALLVALTSDIALLGPLASASDVNYIDLYMEGFTGFFKSWFFMFLLGAIFGKAMEYSQSADSIAHWIIHRIGIKHAALAVVVACAVLTYGGVSVFIVAFSVYAMALSLFKEANLPRRFIPAVIAFGSVTFTMTSAGSPEIQNWIPIKYLGTTPYAGWQVSLVVSALMATFGYYWMRHMITVAVNSGECFERRDGDIESVQSGSNHRPRPIICLLPLVAVLACSFLLHESLGTAALIVALLSGILVIYSFQYRYLKNPELPLVEGATGSVIAISNTCAVVGFGAVAKATPAFTSVVDVMTHIPGGGLVGAAIAITVICGLTGSASGGQTIALPLLAPLYVGDDAHSSQRVDSDALHRVVSIASGGLDSLPHNGYVVTLIRSICGDTHKDTYLPLAKLTVVIPLVGTVVAIFLFNIFS